MGLKDFFKLYLSKVTDIQRLATVEKELSLYSERYSKEEIALLNVFIDLLKRNPENALKHLRKKKINKATLSAKIGYGIINLSLGQRDRCLHNAVKAVAYLKKALSIEKDMPYIYLRLARGYKMMEYLSDKVKDETKEYKESLSLLDEAEGLLNKREKFARACIYNEYGDIYMKMQEYEKAKKSFCMAIKACPKQPFSYNWMGNVYRNQNELYKAILYYKKSLKLFGDMNNGTADNIECAYPLNYMGDCYRYIEDYSNAKKYYTEAIRINPKHAFPLNGLGRVYYELGNRNGCSKEYYDQAAVYFEKAIKLNNNFKYAIYNLGRVCERLKKYEKAVVCYQEALHKPPYNNYWEERINGHITEMNSKVRLEKELNGLEQEKQLGILSLEESVIARTKLNGIEENIFLKKNSFTETFLKEKFLRDEDREIILFEVLRRWDSYTPIIADGSKGGGYFIKAFGKGIVMDPGFNFIENFIEAKYQFADIDIVLISHAHDDHTADLESIINLLYRYNKELKESKIKRQIAKETCIPKSMIDKEKGDVLDARFKKYKKRLSLYVSQGVMKKYKVFFQHENCCILGNKKNVIDQDSACGYGVKALAPGKMINLRNETYYNKPQIEIEALPAKHDDIIKDAHKKSMPSLGFKLDFGDTVLIYTGDTGWSDELDRRYREIKEKCTKKGQYVILLAHIGGFDRDESMLLESVKLQQLLEDGKVRESLPCDKLQGMLYDKHLGRLGLVKLNEALEPNLCIISEFGEEFKGYRVEISKIFNEVFSSSKTSDSKTLFLPADIGMKILIKGSEPNCMGKECHGTECSREKYQVKKGPCIKAISKIDRENRRFECQYTPPKDVEVGEYLRENKLFFYKKGAGISESDCLQAFIEDFGEDSCKIEDCMEHMVCQRRKK